MIYRRLNINLTQYWIYDFMLKKSGQIQFVRVFFFLLEDCKSAGTPSCGGRLLKNHDVWSTDFWGGNIRKILKEKGCKRQVSYLDIDLDIDKGSIVTDAVKMNKEICYSNFIGLCDTIAEESVASEHRKIVQVNNVFEVRPKGIGVS